MFNEKEMKRIQKNYDVACARHLGITLQHYRNTYRPKGSCPIIIESAPKEDEHRFYAFTDEEMIAFFEEYIVNKLDETFSKLSFRVINGGKK